MRKTATALGLLLLFGGEAAYDAGGFPLLEAAGHYFWVAWPIGGIACGIATLAMRGGTDMHQPR